MDKNRPQSILWFERLFFTSFAITFVDLIYHREMMMADFDTGGEFGIGMIATFGGILLFSFGVQILLWYFIAHRASSIARTIYTVFWALGLFGLLGFLEEYTTSEKVFLTITQLVVLASIIVLYRPDASIWLKSKGQVVDAGEDLPEVFK